MHPTTWPLALLFAIAGTLHFLVPRPYEQIIPAYLAPLGARTLVYLSGAAELLGGLGVLYPPTRTAAGWGLILLLVAVFPANVEMWMAAHQRHAAAWVQALFLARLPLQALLISWVWAATIHPPTPA